MEVRLSAVPRARSSAYPVGSRPAPLGTYMSNPSSRKKSGLGERRLRVMAGRCRRYALRSEARCMVPGAIRYCGLHLLPKMRYVSVRYSREKLQSSVNNLVACGSVWVCAVCAARITELRRRELEQAIGVAREQGLQVVLVTLTIRHHAGDDLRPLSDVLLSAWRSVVEGRAGQRLRGLGMVGFVRALEVTHGKHGWHPHLHVLMFLSAGADLGAVEGLVTERWALRAGRLGHAVTDAGVDFRETYGAVADYVAKFGHEPATDEPWGVSAEMAKWPVKQGRSAGPEHAGRTPMQLLSDSMEGDDQSGVLFRLYAFAMKGRRQLVWSRGLRELLELSEEVSDQEAAEMEGEDMPEVARLTPIQWQFIFHHGQIPYLLMTVEEVCGDRQGIAAWLRSVGAPSDATWVADSSPSS